MTAQFYSLLSLSEVGFKANEKMGKVFSIGIFYGSFNHSKLPGRGCLEAAGKNYIFY